jgi:hypothetical protein
MVIVGPKLEAICANSSGTLVTQIRTSPAQAVLWTKALRYSYNKIGSQQTVFVTASPSNTKVKSNLVVWSSPGHPQGNIVNRAVMATLGVGQHLHPYFQHECLCMWSSPIHGLPSRITTVLYRIVTIYPQCFTHGASVRSSELKTDTLDNLSFFLELNHAYCESR